MFPHCWTLGKPLWAFNFICWVALDFQLPIDLLLLDFQSRNNPRAGEMVQWRRVLVPLPEHLGLIPSSHRAAHNHL